MMMMMMMGCSSRARARAYVLFFSQVNRGKEMENSSFLSL
jgi:hypothetical protein